MLGIDGVKLTAVTGLDDIAQHDAADRACALAGTDHDDRLRFE